MESSIRRRTALITGANSGMGRACARAFGDTLDLILTDMAPSLPAFAAELTEEGYTVREVVVGSIFDDAVLTQLVTAADVEPGMGLLVHAAGLSPALADWRNIMTVNLVASERLICALEPVLRPQSVAVLIASMAGHMAPAEAKIDAMLDAPAAPAFMENMTKFIEHTAAADVPRARQDLSYLLSKRGVIRMCERHAAAWGRKGSRIVSVSPGTIWTPMGRKEATESPGAAAILQAAPAGRWGTVMDIVAAVRFLASPQAGFISGSDLRVDGGVTACLRAGF